MDRNAEHPDNINQTTKATSFESYNNLLERHGLSYKSQHPWLFVGEPSFENRYIVCLSIPIAQTKAILRRALIILKEYGISFILVNGQLEHNRINNHAYPAELFGKPLFAFPSNLSQTIMLAQQLAESTNSFHALELPNCMRVGSICYAAYSQTVDQPSEQSKTIFPYQFVVPKELENLLKPFSDQQKQKVRTVLALRYVPISTIISSHKGNILKGFDLKTLRYCFIKQARNWAGEDIYGRQMKDRLSWQMQLSNLLQYRINIPEPIQLLEFGEYSYFITQYIHGESLGALIKAENTDNFTLLLIIQKAAMEIHKMHEAGYVHRDITAKNILRSFQEKVYLTDLELAYPIKGASFPPFENGTTGYMSRQQTLGLDPNTADDVFALGALLYFVFSKQHPRSLCDISEEERNKKIHACGAPPAIASFMQAAQSNNAQQRPQIQDLIAILKQESDKAEKKVSSRHVFSPIKKLLVNSLMIISLAMLSVYILWQTSGDSNLGNNGFERTFLSPAVQPSKEIALPKQAAYIAGLSADSIYLSSTNEGQLLAIAKNGSQVVKNTPFLANELLKAKTGKPSMSVTPFGMLLFDGTGKTLVSKKESNFRTTVMTEPFSRVVPINDSLVILRKAKPGIRDQVLYLFNRGENKIVRETRVTPKRNDGGYSTTGLLAYDTLTKRAAYVTRYANRIILLDHNLNITKKASTIDTFSSFRTRVASQTNQNSETVSNQGPQRYVNRSIAMDAGILFVKSALIADNEKIDSQNRITVIDLYDQLEGKYLGSLRLDKSEGKRLRNFAVSKNKIYCLYPAHLKIYDIPSALRK